VHVLRNKKTKDKKRKVNRRTHSIKRKEMSRINKIGQKIKSHLGNLLNKNHSAKSNKIPIKILKTKQEILFDKMLSRLNFIFD